MSILFKDHNEKYHFFTPFFDVEANPDAGTPENGNAMYKAAEKVANVKISKVNAGNPLSSLVRPLEKTGRKWESVIVKLCGSTAYNRASAPGAPTPAQIVARMFATNVTRDFKTSVYPDDVAAVSVDEAGTTELADAIVGSLGASRDDADYRDLAKCVRALGQFTVLSGYYESYASVYAADPRLKRADTAADLVKAIIAYGKALRLTSDKFTGTTSISSGAIARSENFRQVADEGRRIVCVVNPTMYAAIMDYIKTTPQMTADTLGVELLVVGNDDIYRVNDGENDHPVAVIFDDRAVGLVRYCDAIRSVWNNDAWAEDYKLHEVANAYASKDFNSAVVVYHGETL